MSRFQGFSCTPKFVTRVSLNPPSVPANTVSALTFTVKGVMPNMLLVANPPALATGLHFISIRVTAKDTVEIKLWNASGAAIDDTARDWLIMGL